MLSLPGPVKKGLAMDEALGHKRSRAEVAAMPPVYLDGGVVTAANMAAEGDGASALLIAGADRAGALGLVPIARLVSFATIGSDPLVWPAATVSRRPRRPSTVRASTVDDIDWWEVHESSAVAVQAWLAEMKVGADQVNPTGGALATTAPLGAVGAGLFVSCHFGPCRYGSTPCPGLRCGRGRDRDGVRVGACLIIHSCGRSWGVSHGCNSAVTKPTCPVWLSGAARQGPEPVPAQVLVRALATGHRHDQGLERPDDLGPVAVGPLDVGSS